jgi:acetyl-CoA C-acetyltransferase
MSPDPRHPVIVGVAQATWPGGDAPSPIEMCAEVVAAAARDAGAGDALLARARTLAVVDIASRRWNDPGALIARRLGIDPGVTIRSSVGGDSPQVLVSRLATRIAQGELDVAIVCGAEALATVGRALRSERELPWEPVDEGAAPTEVVGTDRTPANPEETDAGLIAPILMYPLFENALWGLEGTTLDEHRARLGELWAGFSRVAASNPYAWSPQERSAAEIATPSADNRLVTLPYTKLLNSNIQTDQAAALILCSDAVARDLGIDRDRWVYPHAAGHAYDHWFVSERENLHSSPAIRFAARAALEAAGAGIDEIAHLDVYSCFPSAVQISCRELGIDPFAETRPLTVTGGLTFAGGPGNNYVTHAIATLVERLREDPGALGLTTAVGWYLTKHAVGIYGSAQPRAPFTAADVQAQVDATPTRASGAGVAGTATGESATLAYSREGEPAVGALTALLPDGRRAIAKVTDPGVLAALCEAPVTGREVVLDGVGGVRF